ncbi:MAG: DUF998 domain-containing protein [Trebonia sp.]
MTDRSPQVTEARTGDGEPIPPDRVARRVRRLARLAVVAQVAFVASWLLAAAWQGPRYSFLGHSISDMYADTAPGAAFLIVVITLCGAATIWFAWRSLRPALRPAGWPATVGSVLLALSVFGLGDLLTVSEREACRLADPGCTASSQVSNAGGTLDGTLTTVGLVVFVAAGFFLAAAMKRIGGWESWVRPVRWWMALMIVLLVGDAIGHNGGLSGLLERLIALAGATGIAVLAAGVSRRSRTAAR